jgi:hypothetical protein
VTVAFLWLMIGPSGRLLRTRFQTRRKNSLQAEGVLFSEGLSAVKLTRLNNVCYAPLQYNVFPEVACLHSNRLQLRLALKVSTVSFKSKLIVVT